MNAIKEQRLKCGMTQKQLADAVGKTTISIQKWEHGKHRPSDECFQKLAEALGCSIELIWIPPKAVSYGTKKVLTEEKRAIREANQKKVAPYIAEREKQGLSKRQLAEKAGVHATTIYGMESGKYYPCWETRQKLRRALGMPEERFYTEEERNALFLELELEEQIHWLIRKNRSRICKVHMDTDDLYQDLAICALRAIDRFQPDGKATLKTFVERNMSFLLEKELAKFCMHGLSGKLHYPLPGIAVYSLDALMEEGLQLESDDGYTEYSEEKSRPWCRKHQGQQEVTVTL